MEKVFGLATEDAVVGRRGGGERDGCRAFGKRVNAFVVCKENLADMCRGMRR